MRGAVSSAAHAPLGNAAPDVFHGEVAIAWTCPYLARMLQRTLPAGFIAPCLPTKSEKLPSGSEWLGRGIFHAY
jgi:hypothetical protein